MKIEKSERRELKNRRKRLGMRVHGKDIALLLRIQEKKDRERMEKHDRRRTDPGAEEL